MGCRDPLRCFSMGWTFVHKSAGVTAKEFLVREFNRCWEGRYWRVLDCAVVNLHEAYLAIEAGDASGPQEVFALVCLLGYRPSDYYNFGYKDMSEEMHPFYYNCPERILKLLTPTDSKSAQEWREKCWERIRAKKARPGLRKGLVIQFAEPIEFRSGRKESVFRVEDPRRLVLTDCWGNRYKIRRWHLEGDFEVLADFPPVERKFRLEPDFRPGGEARYEIRSMTREKAEQVVLGYVLGYADPVKREKELEVFWRDPDAWLEAHGMLPLGHHVAVLHGERGIPEVTYIASFSTREEAESFLRGRIGRGGAVAWA